MRKIFFKNIIILILFLAISIVLFFPILNNFFLSDDFDWLHTVSQKQESIADIFTTNNAGTLEGNSYRPFVSLIFYIGYKLWGLNPLGYHLISVIILGLTAFLVFLITKRLWFHGKRWLIAFLAGLFFVTLNNHVEVAAWPSVYPDLLATFFYLLAFYMYLLFATRKKKWKYIIALVFFVLAILSKEIAISLAFVLIVYEFLRLERTSILERFKNLGRRFLYILGFLIVIVLYFVARFFTTGYLFGYYGREGLVFDKFDLFRNFVNSVISMFLSGEWRVNASNFIFSQRWIFIFVILTAAVFFPVVLKKYRKQVLFLYAFFLLAFAVVYNVQMSLMNDEGEIYYYLPSAVFCIFLAIILVSFWQKYWKCLSLALAISFIIYSSYFTWQKVQDWVRAGSIAENMIKNFGSAVNLQAEGASIVFVALPENYNGAQLMRNAINYAINFYYPDFKYNHYFVPIYLRLDNKNWDKELLKWNRNEGWIYAKTAGGRYIVSGNATMRDENFYHELRGYNYDTSLANSIWIEVLDNFKRENQGKKIYWLSFNEGGVVEVTK